MNGCQGNTSACTGRDLAPIRFGLGRVLVACGECRRYALDMGAVQVERRHQLQPVPQDRRRRFTPPWLRHLTARDETGSVLRG